MKLYRIEVTKVLYVVAEDDADAELAAYRYAREDDNDPLVSVTLATRKMIQRDGYSGALVYGDHRDDYPALEAVKLND